MSYKTCLFWFTKNDVWVSWGLMWKYGYMEWSKSVWLFESMKSMVTWRLSQMPKYRGTFRWLKIVETKYTPWLINARLSWRILYILRAKTYAGVTERLTKPLISGNEVPRSHICSSTFPIPHASIYAGLLGSMSQSNPNRSVACVLFNSVRNSRKSVLADTVSLSDIRTLLTASKAISQAQSNSNMSHSI